ncbi:MAG TPA: TMEM14 family protein [Isosphaeraceae bacterium]|jgi:uncharacterized membrane protein (UPF0136 family)|nr:TMEM14 family protein [Isosphaeraceae bacterium]
MDPILGQIALGIYALLLACGGVMGYVKAGSKPSLVAGLASACLAILSLVVAAFQPTLGLGLGAVLALLLLAIFGARFLKSRKFMPSGLLLVVSLVMVALLIVLASQTKVRA